MSIKTTTPCVAVGLAMFCWPAWGDPPHLTATVTSQPLHGGRVDPKLFGNFIELLDDVVPGMWAEMLNDRSFEGILPAANWCYYDGSPDICDRPWDTNTTWSYDTAKPFNGSRSAKLTAASEPATLTQSGLATRAGLSYTFSGYFRAEGGLKVTARLKFLLPTGEWMTLGAADLPALSSPWQKCSVPLRSAGQTDRAVFELRAEGQGSLWADKLSLLPDDHRCGWRPDVVEAIQDVRPGIIRWGGSSVDPGRYRWKEGLGDRDRRTPWRNQNWGRLDSNDVGIDEFCQFCALTKSEPLICVSFADGPESAGELVEYCNGETNTVWGARRAAHGHPAPYQVRYWQIGNEINGNDPQYLAQLPVFLDRMKKADPQVLAMTSFPTQKLLNAVGKDVAYVCPHHYTPDLAACERDFRELAEMIDHTPGCAHLKLGVTEWNIDAGSWGLGRAKQATLEAALMNARYLNLMMRHSDKVALACRSNLANSYCGAIIETATAGSGVLKRASYYVMQLYARHARPVPLWLEPGGDRLDLFASAADDRKNVVLFAVNPRPEPVELTMTFQRFAGPLHIAKAEAVCDTLQAGQPDVMNHWNAPDRVRIVTLPTAPAAVTLPPLSAVAVECEAN